MENQGKRDWRKFYKLEAGKYDLSRYGSLYGRLFKRLHQEEMSYLLSSYAPGRALDIAAGTGHASFLLASIGFDLTSIDLTKEMLRCAQYQLRKDGLRSNFMLGDAFELPFRDDVFDVVVSTRFLHLWSEHNQKILLCEMVRVLKPGGILVVDFDNWWHRSILRVPIFVYQTIFGKGRVVEEYYSRVERTIAIMESEGLDILHIKGVGGYFLIIPLMISYKFGLSLSRIIGRFPHYMLSEQFLVQGQKK